MAYPNPLPSSGELRLDEITAWMIAAGEIAAQGEYDFSELNAASHLTDKTAPFDLSDWWGYAIAASACGNMPGASGETFVNSENQKIGLTYIGNPGTYVIMFQFVRTILSQALYTSTEFTKTFPGPVSSIQTNIVEDTLQPGTYIWQIRRKCNDGTYSDWLTLDDYVKTAN